MSLITLSVNGLSSPSKRQRSAEWKETRYPTIQHLPEPHLSFKDTYGLKLKGWKKIFHTNSNQKRTGVAILQI